MRPGRAKHALTTLPGELQQSLLTNYLTLHVMLSCRDVKLLSRACNKKCMQGCFHANSRTSQSSLLPPCQNLT